MALIESRNNPIIKRVRSLEAAKQRRELGLHLVEGEKLVREAVASGAAIDELFAEEGVLLETVPIPENVPVYTVTRSVLTSMADSCTPQGIVATVRTPDTTLPKQFPEGMIVVLDGVQDPGNVGAILRSADAFGAKGAVLSPACADPYSPKSIRAAMGSTYHLPIWRADAGQAVDQLKQQEYFALCGHLHGTETLPKLPKRTALVIGNEGNGVSYEVARRCELYRLPMYGKAESLNAAVAAGILLYIVGTAAGSKG